MSVIKECGKSRLYPALRSGRFMLQAAAASEKGGFREANEDITFCDARQGVFVVADGMGGYGGGAVASKLAVEQVAKALCRLVHDESVTEDSVRSTIEMALRSVIRQYLFIAKHVADFERMGCTLAFAVAHQGNLFHGRIGDCRVYHIRGQRCVNLHRDESLVQSLIHAGTMTSTQARTSDLRHIVLNCVSVRHPEAECDVYSLELSAGDRILLTTDGLSNEYECGELGKLTKSSQDDAGLAAFLVDEALQRGSRDNASCVFVRVTSAMSHA